MATAVLAGCTPPPSKLGLAFSGSDYAGLVRLLVDETWVDAGGTRHVQQEIFDSVYEMIDSAERFILIDMFLLNDFAYVPGPCLRPLSQEITDRLLLKRGMNPDVDIVFITDPINTVYGSIESPFFKAMEEAGVRVVRTDLDSLRDSNPLYSKPWRLLVKPFGTGPGRTTQNPLGEGRISLRSLLKLFNFKANHRKLIVTDKALLVTSANPHSASSAHWNTALRVDGAGQTPALEAESAILKFSGAEEAAAALPAVNTDGVPAGGIKVELLTEIRIKEKALEMLHRAGKDDRVELTMFYLSEKAVMNALIEAGKRGADIRIILDPNKDAFGRIKNGVPNRQSAARLVQSDISLRWADTHAEQCHVKMLYVEHGNKTAELLLGSANFTRRNLDNYNCEADLAVTGSVDEPCMIRAREVFDRWWNNPGGRHYTTEYATYEDSSCRRKFSAGWKERTGMGTF
jgi:phosphatidylserine/phosphatidylglycerophosphate/cardiolipin synthase-like enzyme